MAKHTKVSTPFRMYTRRCSRGFLTTKAAEKHWTPLSESFNFDNYFPDEKFYVKFQVAFNVISRLPCKVQSLCVVPQVNFYSRRSSSRRNISKFERRRKMGLSLDEVQICSPTFKTLVLDSCTVLGGLGLWHHPNDL